ncbi:MAG: hypothetical protein J5910_03055 [Lachnospiraceae bacterium]|nr:hypothetical protein [Lachnospiraceae bacterium]
MRGKSRKGIALILSTVLGVATCITTIPNLSVPVYAAGTGKDLQLGPAVLGVNVNTATAATVYYGRDESNNAALSWRVIGYNGTEQSVASSANTATLLASDKICNSEFDDVVPYSNEYAGSKLQSAVNIYTNGFTSIEDSNIISRTLQTGSYSGTPPYTDGVAGTEVSNAKLWPLSAQEAYYTNNDLRRASFYWWVRSPGPQNIKAACVSLNGATPCDAYVKDLGGVRPAFNLNLSSIILTSDAAGIKSSGVAGTLNAPGDHSTTGWKLTVKDDGLTVAKNGSVTRTGTTITVPYTITKTGTSDYDRVSVFISNKEWNAEGAVLKYYGELDTSAGDGTGSFTLPGDYDPSWKVYILAEKINGDTQTDYASAPVKITIPAVSVVLVDNDAAPNIISAQASSVYFGNYFQSNSTDKEPIKWRVLRNNTTNRTLFLLSDQSLDAMTFAKTPAKTNVWADCTLRKWLNGYESVNPNFINTAFDSREIGAIAPTANVSITDTDMLFLLSVDEVQNTDYGFTNDEKRVAINTTYAGQKAYGGAGNACLWWLRSPGRDDVAASVGNSGYVDTQALYVDTTNVAVRPALNINLSSALLTSAAEDGKISGTTGANALTAVEAYSGSEWKLTVHDTSRDGEGGFTAERTDHNTLARGAELKISYSGATTGNNEYVSAIITNAAGTVLYYGHIASTKDSASGTATINIPADAPTTMSKLYVFQEQCNGDKKTDYSSRLLDLTEAATKQTPSADDFTVTLPTDLVYDGNPKEATAVAASGISGMGDITVKYYKDGTELTGAPKDIGTYMVKLDVTEGADYTSVCDITKDAWTFTITAPHTHSFTSSTVTPATCTTAGEMIHRCTGCDYCYTSTIPALGHNYVGTVTKEPTVLTEGVKTYKCSREGCGDTYTETIPRLEPSQEEAKEIEQLLEDLTGDDGKIKADVDVETKTEEDGTSVTTIKIDDKEVYKKTVDKDGEETVETNIWTVNVDENDLYYTGKPIEPTVHVYDGIKRLAEGSDYSVKYSSNKNAGSSAKVTVSFTGGYKGTSQSSLTFTILPSDLGERGAVEPIIIAATGKLQKPTPSVTIKESGFNLKEQTSYKYYDKDKNPVNGLKEPGDYTVKITPKKNNKNLTGEFTGNIKVTGDKDKLMSSAKVTLNAKKVTYEGKPTTLPKDSYIVSLGGDTLAEGTDYEVTYVNNTVPGDAKIIFTAADGNAKGLMGSTSAIFTITKGRELSKEEGSGFSYIFNKKVPFTKSGAKPSITVMDGESMLKEDVDYTVSYSKNRSVTDGETAVITIKGKGNYKGTVKQYFAIEPADIANMTIEAEDKVESKNGYKNPKVTIKDPEGKKLTAGKDYVIGDDYTAPDKDGIVTVTITGKKGYEGSSTKLQYRYIKEDRQISKASAVKIKDRTYTGSAITLKKSELNALLYTGKAPNIKYLVPGEDFTVTYKNNVGPGTAKVIVKGIGKYGGARTLTFKIKARKSNVIEMILKAIGN